MKPFYVLKKKTICFRAQFISIQVPSSSSETSLFCPLDECTLWDVSYVLTIAPFFLGNDTILSFSDIFDGFLSLFFFNFTVIGHCKIFLMVIQLFFKSINIYVFKTLCSYKMSLTAISNNSYFEVLTTSIGTYKSSFMLNILNIFLLKNI